jgi:hypothetical protein
MNLRNDQCRCLFELCLHGYLGWLCGLFDLDLVKDVRNQLTRQGYCNTTGSAPDSNADTSVWTSRKPQHPLNLPWKPASGVDEHGCLAVPEL